jgi:hypothetical protein
MGLTIQTDELKLLAKNILKLILLLFGLNNYFFLQTPDLLLVAPEQIRPSAQLAPPEDSSQEAPSDSFLTTSARQIPNFVLVAPTQVSPDLQLSFSALIPPHSAPSESPVDSSSVQTPAFVVVLPTQVSPSPQTFPSFPPHGVSLPSPDSIAWQVPFLSFVAPTHVMPDLHVEPLPVAELALELPVAPPAELVVEDPGSFEPSSTDKSSAFALLAKAREKSQGSPLTSP